MVFLITYRCLYDKSFVHFYLLLVVVFNNNYIIIIIIITNIIITNNAFTVQSLFKSIIMNIFTLHSEDSEVTLKRH